MTTLREQANMYERPRMGLISDLDKVNTEVDFRERVVKEGEPDEFTVSFIEVDGKEYRVPGPVLEQLKEQLAAKPASVWFKVVKKGEGLNSKYTVIMLD